MQNLVLVPKKALKKIVGNDYGTNEIKFSKLVQAITLEHKKVVKNYLDGQEMVSSKWKSIYL